MLRLMTTPLPQVTPSASAPFRVARLSLKRERGFESEQVVVDVEIGDRVQIIARR